MRTYSTPQSALNQEITKLAIIECIASTAVYVGIAVYLGTFRYLAAAVIFAPLMLFRTEVSANWGLKVYERCNEILDKNKLLHRLPEPYNVAVMLLIIALLGTAIRIIATVYWLFRRPLQTLRDTPQNWLRQSLCTDFAHPPEVVPLEAAKGSESVPTFKALLEESRLAGNAREHVLTIVVFGPFIFVGWFPSVIYRVSFKDTAIAYTPFIWAAHATLRNPLLLKARLERITKGELEKVRRGFSWIILTTWPRSPCFSLG
jgi:hypothetical protein